MASTTSINFSLLNVKGAVVTATPSSVRTPINVATDDIMLVNDTLVTIFARVGDSTVLADATAMPILSGEKGVYSRGGGPANSTHIAVFVVAATADITIFQGVGA